MEDFEYIEPKSLQEAVALFAKFKNKAKLLAGGTDLIVALKNGRIKPKYLINLKKIKGLNRIRFNHKEGLRVGALVTWTEILSFQPIARFYPLLREASLGYWLPPDSEFGNDRGEYLPRLPRR